MDLSPFRPFLQTPLINNILEDPAWEAIGAPQPRYKGHDSLWYELLSEPGGVRAHCMLCRRPQHGSDEPWRDTRHLLLLGPALTSKQGVCHGGLLAVIADEVAIMTIRHYGLDGGTDPSTAFLNVTYTKSVSVPGVVMATVKVMEKMRRKIQLRISIVDGHGQLCVTAETLVVTAIPRI